MSAAYADRFAAELRAALPNGFTVEADDSLTVAHYGADVLTGWAPRPRDRRAPVSPDDVREWIDAAALLAAIDEGGAR